MNRTLALFSKPIPYYKGLRPLAGGVLASILMQQLEYWFDRSGNGFYKFLQPCENIAYKVGDSWIEELGFSVDEFRTAFDKIGTRFKSRTEYLKAIERNDGFNGRLYASYHDKIRGLTFYFRNHKKVDDSIANLVNSVNPNAPDPPNPPSTEIENPDFRKLGIPISVNGDSQSTEMGNPHLIYKDTENTPETTPETTYKEAHAETQPSLVDSEEPNLDQLENMISQEEIRDYPNNLTVHPENRHKNELIQEDTFSAPTAIAKDFKTSVIENIDDLPLLLDGKKRQVPWENPGASMSNRYDQNFCEWAYKKHLCLYTGFDKKGYKENKVQVSGYLLRSHSEPARMEKVIMMWNEYIFTTVNPSPAETSPDMALESFLTRVPSKLKQIILDQQISGDTLNYIAQMYDACGKKEQVTIDLLRQENLIQ